MAKKKIIIAKVLPALLKAKNITAKQLAVKAQVPQSTVATWLIEGARPRNIEDVAEAASVLDVSLNHLLFGEADTPKDLKTIESELVLDAVYRVKLERLIIK